MLVLSLVVAETLVMTLNAAGRIVFMVLIRFFVTKINVLQTKRKHCLTLEKKKTHVSEEKVTL